MLKGTVKNVTDITDSEKSSMYSLMNEFYDNMKISTFNEDLNAKDYAIILTGNKEVSDNNLYYFDSETPTDVDIPESKSTTNYQTIPKEVPNGKIRGFTTLKLIELPIGGRIVHGFFSGDTIIHKDDWGSIELFKTWAGFCFKFAKKYDEFYWFLICKGYKTYRMLPSFWTEFYPCFDKETPVHVKLIIDAYGKMLYPGDYNPETGVMEYSSIKDKLKQGVADIGEHELKNKHTAFFIKANPCYADGNDLACIAKIDRKMLKPKVERLLFS